MTRDVHRLAVLLVLAVLAGGSWWLSRAMKQMETPPETAPAHDPDYIVERFTSMSLLPDGKLKYELSADKLTHYADDGTSELDRPYLIEYGEGAPVHTRAAHGWLPRDNSYIVMTGHVRVARGRDPKSAGGEILTDKMKIILDK
jgi:lipopolysaccharide export system protein LptC